jgi:hypothetical protein
MIDRKGAVLPIDFGRKRTQIVGIDGVIRNKSDEAKLNSMFTATFNTPAGQKVLDYLEMLTLRTVNGPAATDGELRHQEGMRHLASIIIERQRLGKKGK